MQIYDLRAQHLKNPIGLGTPDPILSWKLHSDTKGDSQSAYRITAASSPEKLTEENYDLWDTGKVSSPAQTGISYSGKSLHSCQQVFWQVKVWDHAGRESDWSEKNHWEMGLLRADDWKALWITRGRETVLDTIDSLRKAAASVDLSACAPILSKEFHTTPEKTLCGARLYISGLGIYEAYVNGVFLGKESFFQPGESDVRDTVYYVTYDITGLLHSKEDTCNAISILLGNGQYANYRVHRQPGRYYKYDDARSEAEADGMYGEVKAIAQIILTYTDGTQTIIGTDSSWNYIESPITENSWYGGEDYDARLSISGWNDICPEIPRSRWGHAAEVTENIPRGELRAREFLPIENIPQDLIPSSKITVTERKHENKTRTYLVDMGRNGAGLPEITVDATVSGQMIRMYPAEVSDFTGFDGHIDQASCTQSESIKGNLIYDTYITNASGPQTYHPRMCYHGYRYTEVVAPEEIRLSAANFKGYILRTANEKIGSFSCSDPVLNTINTLTERSIESNMYSTFTDCPQIEKLGWLETPGLMFYSMSQTYDISSWIPKLLRDMTDAQFDNGRIAAIAPEFFRIGPLSEDVNWNGSLIFTAWQYYEVYKDASVFSAKNYRAMKAYMSYLEKEASVDYLIPEGQMGEWGEMTDYGTTPVILVESTAYYLLAVYMSKIADVIGQTGDRDHYRQLADHIRTAFHNHPVCCNPTHLYGSGTQSGYGCVLYSGICLPENKEPALERLIESIRRADYHLTSGEVGLKQVFHALAAHGRNDIVYRMVTNDTMPSYKYFVDKGLTTLPEYWNFEELWGPFVRSRNHAMMGHVKEWFHRYLLGIDPDSPGYDTVRIKPAILKEVTSAKGSIDTIHGRICLEWSFLSGDEYCLKLTLPVGVTATVLLPGMEPETCRGCGEYEIRTTISFQNAGNREYASSAHPRKSHTF